MVDLRQKLLQAVVGRPPDLVGALRLTAEPIDDTHVLLRVAGDDDVQYRSRAAALSVPYPSGLRRLIADDPTIRTVIVERLTSGLEATAEELGIDILDLDGMGRLRGPGFIYIVSARAGRRSRAEQAAASAASRRASVAVFAPKASRVTRTLLEDSNAPWRVSVLAERVQMNPGNVHRVLGGLAERGLVERGRDGYVVPDPGSLLEAWAASWRPPLRPEPIALQVGDELIGACARVVDALGGAGVVSGEVAAEAYAPHLPAAHAIVHCIDPDGWRPGLAAELANLPTLRARHRIVVDLADRGVSDFGREQGGLVLVSPQQLYVDLHHDRGRGREAAEHVRREVLGF
jgi:hypothetical protein